jgi:hypothetical protein
MKWKLSTIISASFVTFMQGAGPLSLAPMFGDYIVAFNTDLAGAVQFTGVAILVLGFSNFIWFVAPTMLRCISNYPQGTAQHFLWSTTSLPRIPAHLLRFCDLARTCSDIRQLHGRMCVSKFPPPIRHL